MNDDELEIECRLRFIELCASNLLCAPPSGVDLYIEGFWAGVEALRQPRDTEQLQALASLAQARAEGLIK